MVCLRALAAAGALVCVASPSSAQETPAGQTGPAPDGGLDGDVVVVTGSREANASINGLVVDPLLLPQSVRVLDDALVYHAGFTDLSQLFDLAGGLSRQNSFGGA